MSDMIHSKELFNRLNEEKSALSNAEERLIEAEKCDHLADSLARRDLDDVKDGHANREHVETSVKQSDDGPEAECTHSSYRFFQSWDDVWDYTTPFLMHLCWPDEDARNNAPTSISNAGPHLGTTISVISSKETCTAMPVPFFGRMADLDLRTAPQGPPDSDEGLESAESKPPSEDESAESMSTETLQQAPDESTAADPVDEPDVPVASSPPSPDWKVAPPPYQFPDSLARTVWGLASSGQYLEATRALPLSQRCQRTGRKWSSL
ncbi:hypothetical protein M408DRAFT_28953 [Serendipita vermifera MAFF 305830]|uniref:Uncharacterized protein n=1 Tax=Serendipita vermifera MAFF 305830 TaxID=933852 RepID=A0A0C2WXW2_SERVB|nr:hypothetical protein M408DRAFT_28953 [Serendipita vermifera MAFF 305830]